MSNASALMILLTAGLIKEIMSYKIRYSTEPYTRSKNKIKSETDLSNYATKPHLKNATGVDTSGSAKKIDLASLKLNIDTLDISELEKVLDDLNSFKSKDVDKLKPGPLHLKKLSDVVDKKIF